MPSAAIATVYRTASPQAKLLRDREDGNKEGRQENGEEVGGGSTNQPYRHVAPSGQPNVSTSLDYVDISGRTCRCHRHELRLIDRLSAANVSAARACLSTSVVTVAYCSIYGSAVGTQRGTVCPERNRSGCFRAAQWSAAVAEGQESNRFRGATHGSALRPSSQITPPRSEH